MSRTETLKDRFKHRLRMVGLNQKKVAELLNQSQSTVSSWLARSAVPAEHMPEVCKLLECEPEWLLSGDIGTRTTVDPSALAEILSQTLQAHYEIVPDIDFKLAADLVAQLYALWEQTGETPANYEQFVRLAFLRQD